MAAASGVKTLPQISVILPVYNGQATLRDSIDSILAQTWLDFELLIFDDGSTDGSLKIIEQYASDPRVRIFSHPNRGLAETLNRGLREARAQWVARQDQDDLSYPRRFETQLEYLNRHPSVGLVGSWAQISTGQGSTDRRHQHPTDDRSLRLFLYFNNPFVHSSVIFRRQVALDVGGYRSGREFQPEDYDLWCRMASRCKLANIPQVLVDYREWPQSMSRQGADPFPFLPSISAQYAERRCRLSHASAVAWANGIHRRRPSSVSRIIYVGLRALWVEKSLSWFFVRRWLGSIAFLLRRS